MSGILMLVAAIRIDDASSTENLRQSGSSMTNSEWRTEFKFINKLAAGVIRTGSLFTNKSNFSNVFNYLGFSRYRRDAVLRHCRRNHEALTKLANSLHKKLLQNEK